VFVVGYLGDWRRAAAVLFERESLSGHPAPSRETGQKAAGYTTTSFGKYSEGVGTIRAAGGDLGGGSETLHVSQPIAYDTTNITSPTNGSNPKPNDPVYTLASGQHPPLLTPQVRRLTPTECERLQGFPDNFTQIPWRNKAAENCPDGPRYKAMGNSMAVPIMRWIGERIKMVDKIESEKS
jgi:DNA (cytosine-5)-methyltransferase 1